MVKKIKFRSTESCSTLDWVIVREIEKYDYYSRAISKNLGLTEYFCLEGGGREVDGGRMYARGEEL